jgi:signal transduction histidine kinase
VTRRRICLIVLLLLLPRFAVAQEAPLTRLADVKALTPQQAEEQKQPVVIRGINTSPSRYAPRFLVQQGEGSVMVTTADMRDLPRANTEVEVTGVTRGGNLGHGEETYIQAQGIRVLATGVTPVPLPVAPEDVAAVRHHNRWVETEGTVLQLRRIQGDLHVILSGDRGYMLFFARDVPEPELPLEWLHARLRIRGVNLGPDSNGMTLMTYEPMNIAVLRPGYTDVFSSPMANPAELRQLAEGSSAPVRCQATVLHTAGINVWLRGNDGTPFNAGIFSGWIPDAAAPHLTSAVPPVPVLHPGDTVEIAGCPSSGAGGLQLRYCHVRIIGSGTPIPPLRITPVELQSAMHRNDLITVSGRASSQSSTEVRAGLHFEGLRLTRDGGEVEVYLESSAGGHLPKFSPDDLLEATGIVVAGAKPGTVRVMLGSAADVRSLGTAPEVTRLRQWRNAAFAGGGTALAAVIIFLLRRQVVKERALAGEVRSLNTSLETRVAERTAELEQAREDLKAALKEEREVGELKSRFVSMVSHEFRTPLGVIMSAADILESYMEKLPPEKRLEHLSEIRSATRHMSGMMEDVLLLGRAESGRLHLTRRPSDLLDLSQRIANETHIATSQSGRTLITCGKLPGPAFVDEMLLRHMLSNLLSNAIKYSPPGSDVLLHIAQEGCDAVISVTDKGIGIPPEDAPRLFQPFSRAGNVGQRSGTGLGLVVVKRCAELHGGGVSFSSTPGAGAVFTLRLPVFSPA